MDAFYYRRFAQRFRESYTLDTGWLQKSGKWLGMRGFLGLGGYEFFNVFLQKGLSLALYRLKNIHKICVEILLNLIVAFSA